MAALGAGLGEDSSALLGVGLGAGRSEASSSAVGGVRCGRRHPRGGAMAIAPSELEAILEFEAVCCNGFVDFPLVVIVVDDALRFVLFQTA